VGAQRHSTQPIWPSGRAIISVVTTELGTARWKHARNHLILQASLGKRLLKGNGWLWWREHHIVTRLGKTYVRATSVTGLITIKPLWEAHLKPLKTNYNFRIARSYRKPSGSKTEGSFNTKEKLQSYYSLHNDNITGILNRDSDITKILQRYSIDITALT
jgi:hypothetical protein